MVQAPISFGELVDKLTILDIKLVNITDAHRLKNVQHEFNALNYIAVSSGLINKPGFDAYYQELVAINTSIWHLENKIRELMAVPTTDSEFIDTAVYIHNSNDERAKVKKKINVAWDSNIVEEKSHKERP